MSWLSRFGAISSLLFCGILGLLLSAGCGTGLHPREVLPLPRVVLPDDNAGGRLILKTLLTGPLGATYIQGGEATRGQDGFVSPFKALARDDGVDILDHGRGVVHRLYYDAQGNLVRYARVDHGGSPFPSAVDLARSEDGWLWVTDSALAAVIRVAPDNSRQEMISGFTRPVGLAWDPHRKRMYVTDIAAGTLHILGTDGQQISVQDLSTGLDLHTPSYIAVGPEGRVFVVDALGSRVLVLDAAWRLVRALGGPGDGPGFFARPKGLAVDATGKIYVVDALFDNVQIFNAAGQLLMALGDSGREPGQFWQPQGVSIGPTGEILVADTYNNRIQVFAWLAKGE